MEGRQVRVYLDNEGFIEGGYMGDNGKFYKFYPGDLCVVEPVNPSKKKHRGRTGHLIGKVNVRGKVGIRFVDTGRVGYVDVVDLVPYKLKNNK